MNREEQIEEAAKAQTKPKPNDDLVLLSDDEREAQGWREAEAYADDHEPSKRAETADDFMAGWRASDRLRRSEVSEPIAEHHDEGTLGKVYEALVSEGYATTEITDMVNAMQNAGILFRERHPEPIADCPQPCEHLSQHDAREGKTCPEHPCTCSEPQGEPSAAQVEAATVAAYRAGADRYANMYTIGQWMRAALRAAGGVR